MTNDDKTRNISKTEDETRIKSQTEEGSGILGIRNSGDRRSEETNTAVAVAARGAAPVTVGNIAVARIAEPTTTPADAAGRIVTIKVEAPLTDVATHIIDSISIRFLLTYTMCLTSTIIYVPTHFI